MAETAAPIILKVLGGTQFGVEVRLEDGEYSFGSGADADIQLTDVAMAAQHGTLRVRKGKIELRADKGRLTTASGLDIQAGETDWREIAQLDVITAGTTSFALGDSSANWAQVVGSTAPAQTSTTTRNSQSNTPARRSGGTVFLALILLAALGLGAAYMTSGDKQLPLITPREDVAQLSAVRNALERLPFRHNLNAEQDVAGQITVSGYVQDGIERRAAEDALIESGISLHRRIWALDAIQTDIDGLLAARELEVGHSLSNRGVLTLRGVILDPAISAELETMISSQVFGLAGIENEIQTTEYFLAEVEGLIDQLDLNGLVLARLDGLLMELTGVIPSDKMDAWVGLIQAYDSRYAQHLPLRSYVMLEGSETTNAVPLILGSPVDGTTLQGRRLPEDAFAEGSVISAESLLARPPGETQAEAPDGTAAGTAETEAPTQPEIPPYIADLVEEFAATNPEIVDAIVFASTDGRIGSLAELQNLGLDTSVSSTNDLTITTASNVEPGAPTEMTALLNGSSTAAQPDQSPSDESTEDAAPIGASTTFQPFSTGFALDDQTWKLINATEALLGQDTVADWDTITAFSEQNGISAHMLDLAFKQIGALKQGTSLITAPISADGAGAGTGSYCWAGSEVAVEKLPMILLWLDILSVDSNSDLMQVSAEIRPLLLEAALSPARISRCMAQSGSIYADMLVENSEFLAESRRNDRFSEFMLRNVPRFNMLISGVNLAEQRYIHTPDGSKFYEGSAPTLSSRLSTIGDLGVIVRQAEGHAVTLYPEDVEWTVKPAWD